jgi:hypothetical protein
MNNDQLKTITTDHVQVVNKKFIPFEEFKEGVTFIKSPKGTGKTTYLSRVLKKYVSKYSSFTDYELDSQDKDKPFYNKGRSVLLIGHRQSLIGDLCNRLGLNSYLNDAGYLIFKSNILRICKASTSTSKHNQAPWGREWFPYIDLYHFVSKNNRVYSTHLTNIIWPRDYLWPIKKCKIRGKDFPCPNRGELLLDSLKKYYGNWRVQQKRGSLINPQKIPRKFPALLPVLLQQKIKNKQEKMPKTRLTV